MMAALIPRQQTAINRIAGLTVANALIFQEVLSAHDPRVKPLRRSLDSLDVIAELADHWRYVVEEIDYVPIFKVARELLLEMSANADSEAAIRFLGAQALNIVRRRAALRHDLMGRIYHRLLVEAKYLGTYYTSVPAATLLLKLALVPHYWGIDWTNLDELSEFRIGDLACGTGTLLMAASEALADNYVKARSKSNASLELAALHRVSIENILYGYDVLPSAVHLTASTLALRASNVSFDLAHLWSLPLGGPHHRLGSIEFLKQASVNVTRDLFGGSVSPGQVTGAGHVEQQTAPLPKLDLCVMNPPFVRSVGGNLLFGSVLPDERRPMQRELARLLAAPSVLASSTAGLGSVFVAVGDLALKEGGRLALVLPKALLSGVAWAETRRLISWRYQLEFLVVSHDPQRWNFSENTNLSEVLVVAKKVPEAQPSGAVAVLNLWRNPPTAFEALTLAHSLLTGTPPDLASGQGSLQIRIGTEKVGEAITVPWGEIGGGLWMLPCAFAQSELVRAAYHLLHGRLYRPGLGVGPPFPLAQLGRFAVLGPDRRDIYDGFQLSDEPTPFPAVWGHDASANVTMAQEANAFLSPLASPRPGRPLRRVEMLWPRAGRVLISERLRLNTQRVAATRTGTRVLSNVWWPAAVSDDDSEIEKALALWLNSTLGLLILLVHRAETEGAWVDFKKPVLHQMPVLDFSALDESQRRTLTQAYDSLSSLELRPFPEMGTDEVRRDIDRVICNVLGLPDLTVLRILLAKEPVVCLEPIQSPGVNVGSAGDIQLELILE